MWYPDADITDQSLREVKYSRTSSEFDLCSYQHLEEWFSKVVRFGITLPTLKQGPPRPETEDILLRSSICIKLVLEVFGGHDSPTSQKMGRFGGLVIDDGPYLVVKVLNSFFKMRIVHPPPILDEYRAHPFPVPSNITRYQIVDQLRVYEPSINKHTQTFQIGYHPSIHDVRSQI